MSSNSANNRIKKSFIFCVTFFFTIVLFGCQGSSQLNTDEQNQEQEKSQGEFTGSQVLVIEFDGKLIEVDRIVSGFLCDDQWSGTIYVDENVEINIWEDEPLFFRDCSLVIEPGTVVMVAAHEGTKFYKGCSCHE